MGSVLSQSLALSSQTFPIAQIQIQPASGSKPDLNGGVDPVAPVYQLGQQLYLETCASCHIAIPPALLPSETWRQLLSDPQHYGRRIELPVDPGRLLIWQYLRDYSRPQIEEEELPYRIRDSRYFKALHPRVKLPRPLNLSTCVTCHPGSGQYNFRSLTPEWENAP
ncbi:diheme cytochrome c [Leptolyngbya sp. 'hensonii']|uniref:diheme cytochrome c n=1 Tax=Leptolyngbya sp. 'hensonii' TaxID=1922337 RepID=UPI00209A7866|nr:diheme cytochrome c [Leptolyngbya sp. 'hensonii']